MSIDYKGRVYIRVPCERCKGTGSVKRPKGRAPYVFAHDSRRRPRCPDCQGKGWNDVGQIDTIRIGEQTK